MMKYLPAIVLPALLVLALGLVGCQYSGGFQAVHCDDSSDCEGDARCEDGFCLSPIVDADVGPDPNGDLDVGDPDAGDPDAGDPDTGDPDTGGPDTGDCDEICCSDEDCEAGEECISNACVCPEITCGSDQCGVITNACGESADCQGCEDGVCVDHLCVECEDAGDCGEGEICTAENTCDCPLPTCDPGVCGTITNACGVSNECDGCPAGEFCSENQCVACDPNGEPYGGGSGNPGDPWRICSWAQWEHLQGESDHWNRDFELYSDLSGGTISPVGDEPARFTGSLDGRGHTISGYVINETRWFVGLFGYLDNATIQNLTVHDPEVSGDRAVGALAGRAENTTFTNVHVTSSVSTPQISGDREVGGLIGRLQSGTLSESSAAITVEGLSDRIGGMVGRNNGTIQRSWATSTVEGSVDVGGLVGHNRGFVYDSYAMGTVQGNTYIGGLVGYHERYCSNGGQRVIARSYGLGDPQGSNWVGGLVGILATCSGRPNSRIDDSYYDEAVGSDSVGGTGMPLQDFGTESSFHEWDFDTVWILEEEGFTRPHLRWELE